MARAAQLKTKNRSVPVEFSTYSFEQLVEIKKDLDGELASRKSKEIEDLRAKLRDNANALGISIEELAGVVRSPRRQTKHVRGPQPARYQGPNGELWSGRGPAPKWMKPLLAKGKKKEDFLIK